jgi:hypothetical protein
MIFDINLVIHFETSFFLYLALSNIPSNQTLRKIQSTQIRADLNLNTGVRYSGI